MDVEKGNEKDIDISKKSKRKLRDSKKEDEKEKNENERKNVFFPSKFFPLLETLNLFVFLKIIRHW
jgi:hypothetical protein